MRIAVLIHSLSVGGAQKLQVTFAGAMRNRGLDVTVIALSPGRHGDLTAELERQGARVVALHGRSSRDPLRAVRLIRLLRHGRFDGVFTHLRTANVLGAIVGRLVGLPVFTVLHGLSPQETGGTLAAWVLRRATTCAIAVGHAVAAVHRENLGGARCVVIPNPVGRIPSLPTTERLAVRHELVGAGGPLLVSTGMLVPDKGYPDLLAAFAEVRRSHPRAALVIAGAGPLEKKLRTDIENLGLRDHARLIGLCSDVPRLLGAADLYVSASHREGLPLGLLEAMAAGLAVVATDVGDVGSVVGDGMGYLVAPKDPAALAAAMKAALDDPERAQAMGATARRYVRENYGVDRWTERLLELVAAASRQETTQSRGNADRPRSGAGDYDDR